MSRSSANYEFVNADPEKIEADLTTIYEGITKRTVQPSSPEKLFIKWVTAALVQQNANINYAANQNIPSRAEGANLDALGELFYDLERPQAKSATVQMLFTISEPQEFDVLIPAGTRVSVGDGNIVFETEVDVFVPSGETEVEVHAVCQEAGLSGNDYEPGTIITCVDPFPYFSSCTNVNTSDGGSNIAEDEDYYALMVASQDAYSTAGARGAYVYLAKSVSAEIGDVAVTNPQAGHVHIYVLMDDGTPATEEVQKAVLAACSADEARPLTDYVVVENPEQIPFNINMKYYISEPAGASATAIDNAVKAAVDDYVAWQCGKFGRDINPSRLISMVVAAGAKRVELAEPVFKTMRDGRDNAVPQIAQLSTLTLMNGGYEDE